MDLLIHTPFNEQNGEVSPDGRWLAYQSNESCQDEIDVRPFRPLTADAGRSLPAAVSIPCGRDRRLGIGLDVSREVSERSVIPGRSLEGRGTQKLRSATRNRTT